MNYLFKHLDDEKEFQATRLVDGSVSVTLDDKTHELKASRLDAHRFAIVYNKKSYEVLVHHSKNECQVWVAGDLVRFALKNEKALRRGLAAGGLTKGSGDVISPMPGKVVSVKVKEGSQVNVGDGVVIVEAMKMQNELKASIAGVVKLVKVKEGDSVEGGMVLAVVV